MKSTTEVRGNAAESLVTTRQRAQISGGCWILKRKRGLGRRENTHSYVSRHNSLCEKSVDCMNEQKWRTTRIFKASSCDRKKTPNSQLV